MIIVCSHEARACEFLCKHAILCNDDAHVVISTHLLSRRLLYSETTNISKPSCPSGLPFTSTKWRVQCSSEHSSRSGVDHAHALWQCDSTHLVLWWLVRCAHALWQCDSPHLVLWWIVQFIRNNLREL